MKYAPCTFIICVAISACSTPQPLFTKDGRPTLRTQCVGSSWQNCQQQARLICRDSQFDVIKATINGSNRELLYACKKSN